MSRSAPTMPERALSPGFALVVAGLVMVVDMAVAMDARATKPSVFSSDLTRLHIVTSASPPKSQWCRKIP